MRRFTQLFAELDATTRTSEKVRALEAYFQAADPADAAWGLFFLMGRKLKRAVTTRLLREWAAQEARIPLWLLEECYDAVGDLSEALALVLPERGPGTEMSLSQLASERVAPLGRLGAEAQREIVVGTWRELDSLERLVWHKLILGEFRVGVARTLVVRALAAASGMAATEMAHRVMGPWEPSGPDFERLTSFAAGHANSGRPYPFFLADQLDMPLEELGTVEDWQVEWKWDGIRAQLIRRNGQVSLWSRGEELITDRFPDVVEIGRSLSDGVVLDGEILAWRGGRPLSFAVLQKRIGRKTVSTKLRSEAPVAFMAYDLLEVAGDDIRFRDLSERRAQLEELVMLVPAGLPLCVSPLVAADSWSELGRLRAEARARAVEGLMLKRRNSSYGVGRPKGVWWKWKNQPYSIDAVLIYAQRGHGRRASLYTDYTFGVWDQGTLVPIAKAYSGLTDEEIHEVDRFVRQHTIEKFGPLRAVEPRLVFELHFEAIAVSKRHKAGLAMRFPRMARWRHDKLPADADTLESVRALALVANQVAS
ncbi:MAG TPA: ATP-dependent DNA ligase [Pirellulales bacterium]|nr:ATP-dependent DNA ligase [Pirellulales bacterium]